MIISCSSWKGTLCFLTQRPSGLIAAWWFNKAGKLEWKSKKWESLADENLERPANKQRSSGIEFKQNEKEKLERPASEHLCVQFKEIVWTRACWLITKKGNSYILLLSSWQKPFIYFHMILMRKVWTIHSERRCWDIAIFWDFLPNLLADKKTLLILLLRIVLVWMNL